MLVPISMVPKRGELYSLLLKNVIPLNRKKMGTDFERAPINEIDGRIDENTLTSNRTARKIFGIHLILNVLELDVQVKVD